MIDIHPDLIMSAQNGRDLAQLYLCLKITIILRLNTWTFNENKLSLLTSICYRQHLPSVFLNLTRLFFLPRTCCFAVLALAPTCRYKVCICFARKQNICWELHVLNGSYTILNHFKPLICQLRACCRKKQTSIFPIFLTHGKIFSRSRVPFDIKQ